MFRAITQHRASWRLQYLDRGKWENSCLLIQQELGHREFVRWAGALGGYMVHIISHPTSCVIWYPVSSSEAEFPPLLQIILADRPPLSELELDRQTGAWAGPGSSFSESCSVISLAVAVEGAAALKVLSAPISYTLSTSFLSLSLSV